MKTPKKRNCVCVPEYLLIDRRRQRRREREDNSLSRRRVRIILSAISDILMMNKPHKKKLERINLPFHLRFHFHFPFFFIFMWTFELFFLCHSAHFIEVRYKLCLHVRFFFHNIQWFAYHLFVFCSSTAAISWIVNGNVGPESTNPMSVKEKHKYGAQKHRERKKKPNHSGTTEKIYTHTHSKVLFFQISSCEHVSFLFFCFAFISINRSVAIIFSIQRVLRRWSIFINMLSASPLCEVRKMNETDINDADVASQVHRHIQTQ